MSETTLRYRFRAYPSPEDTVALSRTFGSCRVVFNDFIAARESAHKAGLPLPKTGDLSRHLITDAKKTPERQWLAEVSAVALQQAIADADVAYRNFFRSIKGQRKGRKVGHPRFRSRYDSRHTARFTSNARFRINQVHEKRAEVTLPRIGTIPFVLSRPLPSDPTSVTVIREADGRTYLSFVVRVTESAADTTGRACGIDVGLSHFATVVSIDSASGEVVESAIENQRYLKRKERALARSQKSLSRRQKGSKNRGKQKVKVARAHRKVRETRLNHAHQQAAKIVATHDIICVEDLSVAGMARTTLAKSVHDTGMAQFIRLLEEKAGRQGKKFVQIGRWFPSTQMCSSCKDLTGPKGRAELKVRHWTCLTCGVSHDRDANSARNILTEGLRLLAVEQSGLVADGRSETQNACGASVSPPAASVAVGCEAGRASEDRQLCSA